MKSRQQRHVAVHVEGVRSPIAVTSPEPYQLLIRQVEHVHPYQHGSVSECIHQHRAWRGLAGAGEASDAEQATLPGKDQCPRTLGQLIERQQCLMMLKKRLRS